jgi:hypothetical protein
MGMGPLLPGGGMNAADSYDLIRGGSWDSQGGSHTCRRGLVSPFLPAWG